MPTQKFRALFLDVDGVLTNGKVWIEPNGETNSTFSVKDGAAIQRLVNAGITVGIISGRDSSYTRQRFEKLGCQFVETGVEEKLIVALKHSEANNIDADSIVYVGDDLIDLECINKFFGVCPGDAHDEIKRASKLVLEVGGGEDIIMRIENKLFNGI